jgi:hypothetical protein
MSRARLAVLTMAISVTFLPGQIHPPAAKAEEVFADCDTPFARDSCNRWYTASSVALTWRHEPGGGSPIAGCQSEFFTAEQRVKRSCTWHWPSTNKTAITEVWIGIDRTPPALAPRTNRPPDYGGWFNHPVGFRFQGQDATSGIRSCTSGTYGGPDGGGVVVRGSCRDVAGNVAFGSFRLNYDGIPPSPLHVDVTPGNRKVTLRWSAPEAVSAQVFRWRTGVAPKLVFSGGGNKYTDRGLRNRRRYQYGLLVTDRAGNRAGTNLTAVPTASKLLSPPPGARVRRPPLLKWKRVRRARYYNVQLYRISGGSASSVQIAGSRKVISRWPRRTRLQLRRSWRYGGKRQHLSPGRYRWFVWPGYGRRSANRYGRLLGKSSFTVVR